MHATPIKISIVGTHYCIHLEFTLFMDYKGLLFFCNISVIFRVVGRCGIESGQSVYFRCIDRQLFASAKFWFALTKCKNDEKISTKGYFANYVGACIYFPTTPKKNCIINRNLVITEKLSNNFYRH